MNVDGSVFQLLQRGGVGDVIRDYNGERVAGFAGNEQFCDILRVEIFLLGFAAIGG